LEGLGSPSGWYDGPGSAALGGEWFPLPCCQPQPGGFPQQQRETTTKECCGSKSKEKNRDTPDKRQEDHRFNKVEETLLAVNTAFYAYISNKSENYHTYLLKGLDNSYTEVEILTDLQALQVDDVHFTKVSQLTTKRSRENNILVTIYIIQISSQSNTSNLLNINHLNYLRIKWEKIIKRNDITRCHKCQLIEHNAGAHIISNMNTENQTYPRQTTSFSREENH
jgi:hypothetical protein